LNIWRRIKYSAVKLERFLVYRVMSLNDTPHRIALGVAVGIFVTWTPTIGLQMILTLVLATLLKANKFVGLPFVWISNPLTFIPIYGPNYWLGSAILGKGDESALKSLAKASTAGSNWMEITSNWFKAIGPIFWELWIGSLIIALFLGMVAYFVIYHMTILYRKKRNLLHLGMPKKSGHHSSSSSGKENDKN